MRRPSAALLALPAFALLFGGCATGLSESRPSDSHPPSNFPPAADLAQLAAQPPPPVSLPVQEILVDEWDLQGPFPQPLVMTPHVAGGPFEKALEREAAARAGTLATSEDMFCVAREIGLFHLHARGNPSDELQRFIVARCGSAVGDMRFATVSGHVPHGKKEPDAYTAWSHDLPAMFGAIAGGVVAGIWYGQAEGTGVVVLAYGTRSTNIEAASLTPGPSGRVTLKGSLLVPSEHVEVDINEGRYGYSVCDLDPSVQLPRFSASCLVQKSDTSAWFDVLSFPAGRVLGDRVVVGLAWPGGTPLAHFARPQFVGSLSTSPDPTVSLAELLNGVRAQAGLAPVRLASAESQTVVKVVPHYFSAMAGTVSRTVADRVALGMMAGWEVEGLVQRGFFIAGLLPQGHDPGRLLASMLAYPDGRAALLTPEVGEVAIGTVKARDGMAALVSSYILFPPARKDLADQGLAALQKARTRNGAPPLRRLGELHQLAQMASVRLEAGQSDIAEVARKFLHESVETTHRDMAVWWVSAHSLADLPFPPELARRPLAAEVAVAQGKRPGEPWGFYSMIVVYENNGSSVIAQNTGPEVAE